jgi:uncharacterized protein YraI
MRIRSIFLTLFFLWLCTMVAAQDLAMCAALTAERIQIAASSCAGRGLNTVCIGSNPVNVGLSGGMVEFLPGDTLALDLVESLNTGASNSGSSEWGMALVSTDAGLSAGTVSMVLFGDATLTSKVKVPTLDLPTLTVNNMAGYDINLREGPGVNFTTIGTFPQGASLVADGRSLDGQWLRVRGASGAAWVNLSLVQVDGNLPALVSLDSLYTSPMQTFALDSAGTDTDLCGVALSGLLVSYNGEERVHVVANGVDIAFGAATLLLQANAEAGLRMYILAGEVQASALGQLVGAGTGGSISMPLNPETLVVEGALQSSGRYPFVAVGGAPLDLVAATSLECVAGVTGSTSVIPYSGPGENYSPLAGLDVASHYTVTGYASDDSNQVWWKLENNRWIPQSAVRTAGLCQAIAQVEAPLMTAASTSVPGSSSLPTEVTIYQAESGPDILAGQCVKPPLAICSHPAAIKPNGIDSFYWRGQEPIDYLMSRAGDGYAFSGRNFANNGNISLALSFTGADSWNMTMTTVFDDDPSCTHTFNYTATRR